MKFGITKYELFALASHLVGLPSPNPEHGRCRLRAWDQLEVAELADTLAMGAAMGAELQLAEWRDRKTMHERDLSPEIVQYIVAGLGGQIAGVWADVLLRLRERLEQTKSRT